MSAHVFRGTLVNGIDEPRDCEVAVDADGTVARVDIAEPGADGGPRPDPAGASGPVITPGFVDVHNHGGARGAFPTGTLEECRRAADYHRSQGTTRLLASFVSGTEEELTRQLGVVAPLVAEGTLAGVHLEGPFVNTEKCGAQAPDRIQDGDPAMFERVLDAGEGIVRSITFAPETPNARALVDLCAERGVIVSLGHTMADYETTAEVVDYAVGRGATVTATHLFNAMPPLHHRKPGAVAALLAAATAGRAVVEVIGDGVHLADGTVDLCAAAAGDNMVLVTDAMEATGMPDGSYVLGPLEVVVEDGVARLATNDGTPGAIAGGTSTLARQVTRFAARHGFTRAVRAASLRPGRLLGLDQNEGLHVGNPAEFVVFDAAGHVTEVFAAGRRLTGSERD
ncbi:N-acetylglucosamine-6-phosphate deacetylase [Corynebacterium frankenforstense DSM 45800]|uniref:N-acetylglucosamine-6-phosphate deacetylase n=1 Tax=Corynebacterium frankenforstense DSM 45800 TaxID=1437875 RepID=A0A1L7CUN2_9CORY|nr:amidohydrolase family protein [Corynebacterium frankenforstense]APT89543.1 N-acetylglucosamine-6-phosphate deacetylase [Corynebacterium frankenforstense DSM 45800]